MPVFAADDTPAECNLPGKMNYTGEFSRTVDSGTEHPNKTILIYGFLGKCCGRLQKP